MDSFLPKFAFGYLIVRPCFVEPLSEWQKTTAKKLSQEPVLFQGASGRGRKYFKDLACVLCLLKLRILEFLSYAVRA